MTSLIDCGDFYLRSYFLDFLSYFLDLLSYFFDFSRVIIVYMILIIKDKNRKPNRRESLLRLP